MDQRATPTGAYALGHGEREQRRLIAQSELLRSSTTQFLREAGPAPGMRVLDVGCGTGDVTFLAADLVGPSGTVRGLDRSADVLATARRRAEELGLRQVDFLAADVATVDLGGPFDAVIGRQVLMYAQDPVAVVRRLAAALVPGGILAFQEPDDEPRAWPPAPLHEACWRWIIAAIASSGANPKMGLHLFATFVAAGLAAPRMRMDGIVGGGGDWPGHGWTAECVRTAVIIAERTGMAASAPADLDTLEDRLRDEAVAGGGIVCPVVICGAWARTPDS
jgi:SAM-dependent methyltransferase